MNCIAVLAVSEASSRKSGFEKELSIFLNWKNIQRYDFICTV